MIRFILKMSGVARSLGLDNTGIQGVIDNFDQKMARIIMHFSMCNKCPCRRLPPPPPVFSTH